MKTINLFFPVFQVIVLVNCISCGAQRTALHDSLANIRANAENQKFSAAKGSLERLEKQRYSQRDEAEVLFTHGYLAQMKALAEQDSTKERSLMLDALQKYQLAHDRSPRNGVISQNLALVHSSLGKPAVGISIMKSAYYQDKLSEYAMFIGDLYLQEEQYDSAFKYFDVAAEENPNTGASFERLVSLYEVVKPDTTMVLKHCHAMYSHQFHESLSQALIYLVRANYRDPNQQLVCIGAFTWWAHLLGSYRVINPDLYNVFPRDWKFEGYRQLRSAWKTNHPYPDLSWWRETKALNISGNVVLHPYEIVTEALRFRAHQLIYADSVSSGIRMYEIAYNFIVEIQERMNYEGKHSPDAFFHAAADLAIAYVKYPDINYPDGNSKYKFNALENRMYSAKGNSYRVRDSTAIAKFHSMLGLIYATQGNWTGPSPRNGIFQLESAIQYSRKTQNLALQRMLLAQGLISVDQADKARKTFLNAASDYLNDDALDNAALALTQYNTIGGDPNVRYTRMQKIMEFRNKIPRITDTLSEVKEILREIELLTAPDNNFPENFFKVQRFKMLSDLGTRAKEVQNTNAATFFHAQALREASTLKNLTNFRDVQRLNQQEQTIRKAIRFDGENKNGFVPVFDKWHLETPDQKETILLQRDVLVAADLITTVNTLDVPVKPEVILNSKDNTVELIPHKNNTAKDKKEFKKVMNDYSEKLKTSKAEGNH